MLENTYEKNFWPEKIIGIDEAGRGPLCGPLVVAGCILPAFYQNQEINDSKKLSAKKREELFQLIIKDALYYDFKIVSAQEIDRLNIYAATKKAMKEIAEKATFWGMFQIGGFNWKNCGCASLEEFVERMSKSEAEQLELFAQFCINMKLVKYLKAKDWDGFAYRYNGPAYKKRSYHTRLRRAHAKHSK